MTARLVALAGNMQAAPSPCVSIVQRKAMYRVQFGCERRCRWQRRGRASLWSIRPSPPALVSGNLARQCSTSDRPRLCATQEAKQIVTDKLRESCDCPVAKRFPSCRNSGSLKQWSSSVTSLVRPPGSPNAKIRTKYKAVVALFPLPAPDCCMGNSPSPSYTGGRGEGSNAEGRRFGLLPSSHSSTLTLLVLRISGRTRPLEEGKAHGRGAKPPWRRNLDPSPNPSFAILVCQKPNLMRKQNNAFLGSPDLLPPVFPASIMPMMIWYR